MQTKNGVFLFLLCFSFGEYLISEGNPDFKIALFIRMSVDADGVFLYGYVSGNLEWLK